jgi:hypothetical protein
MQKAPENIKLPFVILKQNLRKAELPTSRKFGRVSQKGPAKNERRPSGNLIFLFNFFSQSKLFNC